MTRKLKAIIAGGRDFKPTKAHCEALEYIHGLIRITEVVSGTAKGGDAFGERFAKYAGLKLTRMPADWSEYRRTDGLSGRDAGFKRNIDMARYAHIVIALPGGKGTTHMVRIAATKGMPRFLVDNVGNITFYPGEASTYNWDAPRYRHYGGAWEAGAAPSSRLNSRPLPPESDQLSEEDIAAAYRINERIDMASCAYQVELETAKDLINRKRRDLIGSDDLGTARQIYEAKRDELDLTPATYWRLTLKTKEGDILSDLSSELSWPEYSSEPGSTDYRSRYANDYAPVESHEYRMWLATFNKADAYWNCY